MSRDDWHQLVDVGIRFLHDFLQLLYFGCGRDGRE
jgi:hypothetical protein